MKKLAIYIAYHPLVNLSEDGLGRYLSFILQGAEKNGCSILIAMPSWTQKSMQILLTDNQISTKNIEFLIPKGLPFGLKVYNFIKNLKNRKNPPQKINRFIIWVKSFIKRVTSFIKIYFNLKFIVACILIQRNIVIIIVQCVTILLLAPLFLILWIAKKSCIFAWRVFSNLFKRVGLYQIFYKVFSNSPQNNFKKGSLFRYAFNIMCEIEANILIAKLNKRSDVMGCIIPALFWPEVKNIKHPKVIVCPDIVLLEFPSIFQNYRIMQEKISASVEVSDRFICYSEHVKKNHLMKNFSIRPEQIAVIKHAPSLLNTSLNLHQPFSSRSTLEKRDICLQILNFYQRESKNRYLYNFDFSDTRFIVYTSQFRPHKNIFNLIDMYEALLRKHYVNVKLILSGRFDYHPDIYNYISQRGLSEDILSMPGLSTEELAALNYLAICSINPSFFEGGFPFTFTEAYSVGTPSIMSSIPVVLEEVQDSNLRALMLFNPYNVDDMVNKAKWAIENPEKLLLLQKPLFDKISQRTWQDVVTDYLSQIQDNYKVESLDQTIPSSQLIIS